MRLDDKSAIALFCVINLVIRCVKPERLEVGETETLLFFEILGDSSIS